MTFPTLVAVGFSLVLFTVLANLAVFQYARGVLRASVDEAARAGARITSSTAAAVQHCHATAEATRTSLLGGRLGDGVAFRCAVVDGHMTATVSAVLPGWLPLVPDLEVAATGTAVQEWLP